jgi:paraquat-inducible protein B
MSERPHSVAIGAFSLGAILILVTTLLFIGGSGIGRDDQTVVMVFDGSVKGLTIGAPVALRGVQVGQVTDIDLILDSDSVDLIMLVKARISGDNVQRRGYIGSDFIDEMIHRGLRAQLNSQSLLTGLLYVQLDFHPESDLVLVPLETDHLQIPTIPTDLQRLARQFDTINLGKLATDLETIVAGLSKFTSNTALQRLPQRLEETLASLDETSRELQRQLQVAGPRLGQVLDKAALTADTLNEELPQLSAEARGSLQELQQAMAGVESAARNVSALVADESPTTYQLNTALQELSQAGRALQSLAKSIEVQPESLLRGKQPRNDPR